MPSSYEMARSPYAHPHAAPRSLLCRKMAGLCLSIGSPPHRVRSRQGHIASRHDKGEHDERQAHHPPSSHLPPALSLPQTFARFPVLANLKTIHLVETSEGLMRLQLSAIEEALAAAGKRIAMPSDADAPQQAPDEVRVEYFPHVDAVPIDPKQWTMLVAHEFFDALPIHVFERTVSGFRELLVDVQHQQQARGAGGAQEERKQSGVTTFKVSDLRRSAAPTNTTTSSSDSDVSTSSSSSAPQPPKFRYVLSPTETPWTKLLVSSNPRFQRLQPGQRVEISPESWATARKIGELVAGRKAAPTPGAEVSEDAAKASEEAAAQEEAGPSAGGAGLIVDYGDSKAFGSSFRAFKSHAIVDPLLNPGTADLTANVDFSYLSNALGTTSARSMGPMFQAHFLAALGLEPRVGALLQAVGEGEGSDQRKKTIEGAAKRLVDPTGMGAQYKVLGVHGAREGSEIEEEEEVYPFDQFPSSDGRPARAEQMKEQQQQQQGSSRSQASGSTSQ